MIKVDCSELSGETKLALAEAITEGLGGSGVALIDGNEIAIDTLSGPDIGLDRIQSVLKSCISRMKDASAYTVESDGKHIAIRSSVPVSDREKRVEDRLPPGLFQCPVCGFVTTSQDGYRDHLRLHDLIRGVR
jgi:hypothetical protein